MCAEHKGCIRWIGFCGGSDGTGGNTCLRLDGRDIHGPLSSGVGCEVTLQGCGGSIPVAGIRICTVRAVVTTSDNGGGHVAGMCRRPTGSSADHAQIDLSESIW